MGPIAFTFLTFTFVFLIIDGDAAEGKFKSEADREAWEEEQKVWGYKLTNLCPNGGSKRSEKQSATLKI